MLASRKNCSDPVSPFCGGETLHGHPALYMQSLSSGDFFAADEQEVVVGICVKQGRVSERVVIGEGEPPFGGYQAIKWESGGELMPCACVSRYHAPGALCPDALPAASARPVLPPRTRMKSRRLTITMES